MMWWGSATAGAAEGYGYVRLAHLSPDTPAVDVYLYDGNAKSAELILRHVAYGTLSPYQRLDDGTYRVAMRPADAPAASAPVLSAKVTVHSGEAFTVAGMGPYKGIKLDVLSDSPQVSGNSAAVRVIQASVKSPTVTVTAAGRSLGSLTFPQVSKYQAIPDPAASTKLTVTASGASTSTELKLRPGSADTVIVLDGAGGLKLVELTDTTRGGIPNGGVDTGLGGLAPAAHRQPIPAWALPLTALTAGLCAGATLLFRRRTHA